jgi:hypothetical protein
MKLSDTVVIFYGISAVLVILLFSVKYVLHKNIISKYFYFFKIKEIKAFEIKIVEIVNVKKIGTIEIYIGKKANSVKEDGYYLTMNDDGKIKVYSGYQNREGITLGKYLISNYRIRSKYIEKYKLFNDTL